MLSGLVVLHYLICILLVVVVLLQFGKGAETGAVLGSAGSSQNIFSSAGRGNFLTKLTTALAILFFANALALTVLKSREARKSVLDGADPVARPLNNDAANSAVPAQENLAQPKAAQEVPAASNKPASNNPVDSKPTDAKKTAPVQKPASN